MKALVKMTAVSERRGQVAEITEVESGRGKRGYPTRAFYRLRFPDGGGGWFSDREVDLIDSAASSASATGEDTGAVEGTGGYSEPEAPGKNAAPSERGSSSAPHVPSSASASATREERQ